MRVKLLDWQGYLTDYDAPFIEQLDGTLPRTLAVAEAPSFVVTDAPQLAQPDVTRSERIYRNTGLRRRDELGRLTPVYKEYRADLCEQLTGVVIEVLPVDGVVDCFDVTTADDTRVACARHRCLFGDTGWVQRIALDARVYFGAVVNGCAGWVSPYRVDDDQAQLLNAAARQVKA